MPTARQFLLGVLKKTAGMPVMTPRPMRPPGVATPMPARPMATPPGPRPSNLTIDPRLGSQLKMPGDGSAARRAAVKAPTVMDKVRDVSGVDSLTLGRGVRAVGMGTGLGVAGSGMAAASGGPADNQPKQNPPAQQNAPTK